MVEEAPEDHQEEDQYEDDLHSVPFDLGGLRCFEDHVTKRKRSCGEQEVPGDLGSLHHLGDDRNGDQRAHQGHDQFALDVLHAFRRAAHEVGKSTLEHGQRGDAATRGQRDRQQPTQAGLDV